LLADLCKLEEETAEASAAVAAAVGDKTVPNIASSKEQISSEELACFMQNLQQSETLNSDPISLAIYGIVKLKNQQSLQSDKTSECNHQKDKFNSSRIAPLQHTGHLTIGAHHPPSSAISPSFVSVQ